MSRSEHGVEQLDADHGGAGPSDAERRLDAMRRALARSHRLSTLGTIAAAIAHEYHNLLTPVISYCELAQSRGASDPELLAKAVERSLRGAERATRISEALLAFARGEGGDAGCCRVADAVEGVFACLARDPAKDNIRLEIDVPDGCVVAMAPVPLEQVLMNLVLNAKTAMGRRGGRLRIRAAADGDGSAVRIEVSDTGPGIPEALGERVFEPFVTDRATGEPGTGLGLAICRELVDQAGGRITVTSEPDAGATFTLILPPGDATG